MWHYLFRVVEKLLKHGASARKQDKNGYTPLHYAAVSGFKLSIEMVRIAFIQFDLKGRNRINAQQK